MSGENNKLPRLRFPAFRDARDWEEKRIGDIFKITRGDVLSMKLVSDNPSNDSPYPVYSSQTKSNGLAGYYSNYLYEDAITWTTDGANAGDVKKRKGKFYCTNVCGVLLSEKGYANSFVAEILNTKTRNHVSFVGNPKLMNGVMGKIQIPLPTLPEQQKIAACLTSLDDLITAQTQKLDSLKTHKKGLMQQLFPAEGETVPKRRFPEFQGAGDWEERRLGKTVHFLDEQRKPIKESDRSAMQGKYPYYGASGIIDYINDYIFNEDLILLGEDGENIVSRNLPLVFKVSGRCWINNHAHVMKPKAPNHLEFLVQYLESLSYIKYNSGGAQPKLNQAVCKTIPLLLPSPPEQQKIATCLTSLDDLITAQAQKLAHLKTHKKGLMQQLFPTAKEAI